ncbi:TonB-dependent siderophore receptor [Rufibacter glacialis]|uniref:TonB-dependent receptor n=1 Tax=Rufibacter glacialis TaxID=1259555 RepID=A0A5M8QH98_9BACT|nr:TonB-dependent receptor [Rufibacter glacialis]KAA6435425.1 TonB-dependent receptor [Rufibacter glacialis]GGK63324.1 ligand-gated channel [Rufibacter glacialis]
MQKTITLFFLFLFLPCLLLAQTNGRLEGRIQSLKGEALPGISVGLEGTTLGSTTDDEGKFLIRNIPAGDYTLQASGIGYASLRQPVTVQAGQATPLYIRLNTSDFNLAQVEVTGTRSGNYLEREGTTATKMEAALRTVPQSVQVISRRALDQLQVVKIEDAMRNVSGVSVETGFGSRTDIFQIRGFRTDQNSIFKNGFRNPARTYRESANVQQIEVMKGPASVLYGVSDPGGLINITTKKPTAYTFQSVQLTANNFGMIRPAVDLGGTIGESKALKYRFNGVYERNESFRDFMKTKRYFVAPSITYDFSPNTTLSVEAELLNHNMPSDRGIFAVNGKIADVPRSRSLGEPDNYSFYQNRFVQYNLLHKLNDTWSLRHAANFNYGTETRKLVEQNTLVRNSDRLINRRYQDQYYFERYFATQNEIYGRFATGSQIQHRTVAGFEYSSFLLDLNVKRAAYDVLDIYNPVYSSKPKPVDKLATSQDYQDVTRNYGFYVQDFITINQRLNVLLGARYDLFDYRSENYFGKDTVEQKNRSFNPRIGVLYELYGPLSVFANYSTGFQTEIGRTLEGDTFDPLTTQQMEGGIKLGLFQDRLNLTSSYFKIKKSNISAVDARDNNFRVQIGEVISEGMEVDVTGEVLPGLNLIATYSYINAKVSSDGSTAKGTRFQNVSPHNFTFWSTYELQQGFLKGLGFGGGFTSVQSRPGDATDSFRLPGYTKVDATVFYRIKRFHVSVNGKNLTDEHYYDGAQSATAIMPGAPRTIIGTVGVNF